MPNEIETLNAEINEHNEWLRDHPNHPADDKVQVRLSLISKTLKRDELLSKQLQSLSTSIHPLTGDGKARKVKRIKL